MSNVGGFCRQNQEFSTEGNHVQAASTENHHVAFVYMGQSKKLIPRSVAHVMVDPSVQRIENNSFQNCTSLRSIVLSPTLEKVGKRAFSGCTKLSQIEWKQGLKIIDSSAFQNCSALVDLNLPESLVKIEDDAFFGCGSLRSVTMPKTVETIGTMVFCGCFELVDVHLQEGLKVIGPQTFRSCKNLVNINLPNGLRFIGKSTFHWCKSLSSIVIPETVEIIEVDAFRNCVSLVDVNFPEGLRYIGQSAFEDCTSLNAVSLPLNLEEIDVFAFHNCISLIGVEVPKGMKATFGDGCFNGCGALVTMSIPEKDNPLSNSALSGCETLEKEKFEKRLVIERFAHLPVHDVCYNSSRATINELTQAFDCCGSNLVDDQYLKDAFGLTPFHVVATVPNDRVDMLDCLLERYPSEVILFQDERGMTMMDYLLKQRSSRVVPLLLLVLQKGFVDRIWRLKGNWRVEILRRIQALQGDKDGDHCEMTRHQRINGIMGYVGHCMRIEMTSLLELSLWKARMGMARKDGSANYDFDYRQSCRYQCGADVVVGNVVGYLWDDNESETCTALSIYPVCSTTVLHTSEQN